MFSKVEIYILFLIAVLSVGSDFAQTSGCSENNNIADIGALTEAISKDPTNAQNFLDRGIAYFHGLDRKRAKADYEKAIFLDPKLTKAFVARGDLDSLVGNYSKAIADYTVALDLGERSAEVYYERGRAKWIMRDILGAKNDYDSSISIDSRNIFALFGRGRANNALGRTDDADADLRLGLTIASEDIESPTTTECKAGIYLIRGVLNAALKKKAESFNDFSQAINIDPRDYRPVHYRGVANIWFSNFSDAVVDLTSSIEIDPDFAENYAERAKAYDLLAEPEKAKADRAKYLELRSDPPTPTPVTKTKN